MKIAPFELKARSMAGHDLRQNISSGRLTLALSLERPVQPCLHIYCFIPEGRDLLLFYLRRNVSG